MKDKFRENFWIAFPAAAATLILILILSFQTEIQGHISQSYHLLQILPYVLVLIGGIIGINVFIVLLTGIVSGAVIMLIGGYTTPVDLLINMGSGVSGMFETCMVAILVAAMCALIREYGGFDALLSWIHKIFRGNQGRPAWNGTAGRDDGYCHCKQYSGNCHGKSNCKRDGTGVWDHTKKSGITSGYFFLYFPGDHSIWCTDAGGDFRSE